jgi:hypothetical protein
MPLVMTIAIAALALFANSCEESLPSYEPPAGILRAGIKHVGDDTIRYVSGDSNNPDKTKATFQQATGFEISVVNSYEETLQETAEISGTVEITIPSLPQFKQTIPITETAIASSQVDKNGMITINPGDTVKLTVYWNYKMNDTTWAFTKAPTASTSSLFSEGPFVFYYYLYHEKLTMNATATVKLFKSINASSTQNREFTIKFTGKIYCCN